MADTATPIEPDDDTVEVSLDQFMEQIRRDVQKFEDEYKAGMASQPEIFPATMAPPDWYEQIVVHLTGWDEA